MALTLLASALLADPFPDLVAAPTLLAGVWYTFDACWGPASTDPAAAYTVALSAAGVTRDATFAPAYRGHVAGVSGRTAFDLGWKADNTAVYLRGWECAQGFWRVLFPTSGNYTLTVGSAGSLGVTVIGSAPAITSPTLTLLHPSPLNRQAAKLWQLDFSGTYPAGGLDLTPDQLGCSAGLLGVQIPPVWPNFFGWAANKLHVYTAAGEVATGAALTFSATGLFFAAAP